MRVLIAGVLGGIAMFVWTSIAHVATPLGEIGFSPIPNEAPVLAAMRQAIGDKSGLYFFPWVDMSKPDAMQRSVAAMAANPNGWMIYHPPGHGAGMMPATLIAEFVKETIQALIAAFLVSLMIGASFLTRVGAVTLIGVSAGIATNASSFIWYGFPLDFTLAQIVVEVVAQACAGVAIAFWLGRTARA